MLSSEGSLEMNMLTFACKDDAKGVADYLSKCARICLHQQRASPAPKILSNMSKNQVLKEVVGLLCIVVLQMVWDLFIHIMDIFSAESIHLHPIVFGVERSKGMLEENLSSMAYLKTFSAWTKERMRKALLGVHYWIQQPTLMACSLILWEFDVQ